MYDSTRAGLKQRVQTLSSYWYSASSDMVDRDSLVNADESPQATGPRSDNTTNFQPTQTRMQKYEIQEINEDNRQTHKIYHFQNCGTVNFNMDSFNTRTITMENCGNKVPPQVNICPSFYFSHFCPYVMSYYQITELVAMRRAMKTYIHNPMPSLLMVCGYLAISHQQTR